MVSGMTMVAYSIIDKRKKAQIIKLPALLTKIQTALTWFG